MEDGDAWATGYLVQRMVRVRETQFTFDGLDYF